MIKLMNKAKIEQEIMWGHNNNGYGYLNERTLE